MRLSLGGRNMMLHGADVSELGGKRSRVSSAIARMTQKPVFVVGMGVGDSNITLGGKKVLRRCYLFADVSFQESLACSLWLTIPSFLLPF